MATVAVYSLKGGVGKTTLAVNLAAQAATGGRRTLLWDLDPQGAATWLLGGSGKGGKPSSDRGSDRAAAIFSRDADAAKAVRATGLDRLDLIPADRSLRDLDRLFADIGKRRRLGRLVAEAGDHDRVVLDCPPGLSDTAEQAMRAADLVIVPVVPSPLATRAWEEVERHLGGRRPVLPVFSMVDRRRTLHAAALAAHPDWPVVPMASAVESATAARTPVALHAPRCSATRAFADVWRAAEARLARSHGAA